MLSAVSTRSQAPEKPMLERRHYARFVVANCDGVLRIGRDVVITAAANELIAIGSKPMTLGELLTMEMMVDGHADRVAVRVEESRPVVVAGSIWHRILLMPVDVNGQPVEEASNIQQESNAK